MFDRIKAWYVAGLWDAAKVRAAVARGWITAEQAELIFQPAEVPEP